MKAAKKQSQRFIDTELPLPPKDAQMAFAWDILQDDEEPEEE